MTAVAFAPNWLGDAVMALPAIQDLARHAHRDGGRLIVAARARVAPLFDLVPGVDDLVLLSDARGVAAGAVRRDAQALRRAGAARAILFPNSVRSALTAWLAGVPERIGYRNDLRGVLLTRGVAPLARPRHQIEAYRHLAAAAGVEHGAREPALDVPGPVAGDAASLLRSLGWDGVRPLVGLAPGAAYGSAKRWPAGRFARLAARLARARGATCVLVGGAAEAPTTSAIAGEAAKMTGQEARATVVDLAGRTTLGQAAAVMAACRVFVTNDSGAMHLAAAVGTPVVAIFGPTDERETAPVARPGRRTVLLAGEAFCRPCGLRECPIDHRCMTSVRVEAVVEAVDRVW